MTDVVYLALATALAWSMLLFASMARARGWTPSGLKVALGNRDDVPEGTVDLTDADEPESIDAEG